jgi:hypothetical protein
MVLDVQGVHDCQYRIDPHQSFAGVVHVERLYQGCGVCQTSGFYDDPIQHRELFIVEQRIEGFDEILADRATDATVLEKHHLYSAEGKGKERKGKGKNRIRREGLVSRYR